MDKLLDQVLRNQVRVRTSAAGGSGTIIYSRDSHDGTAHTYALTCHHVVESAISVKEDWDSRVGRQRKKEYRQLVGVEFFDWENVPHGHRPLSYSADADIVAYDKGHDMALLKLRTVKAAPGVAHLLPAGWEQTLKVGDPVLAVGAALLHDPIVSHGTITHMGDEIDFKLYWMSSASIIFGNSGGAMFCEQGEKYIYLGIPSRVDVINWGVPVSHLGYFSPITRVYEFLSEQLYHFLIPGHEHTEDVCEREREDQRQREDRRLLMELEK